MSELTFLLDLRYTVQHHGAFVPTSNLSQRCLPFLLLRNENCKDKVSILVLRHSQH